MAKIKPKINRIEKFVLFLNLVFVVFSLSINHALAQVGAFSGFTPTDATNAAEIRAELIKTKAQLQAKQTQASTGMPNAIKVSNPIADSAAIQGDIAKIDAEIKSLDNQYKYNLMYYSSRLKDWAIDDLWKETVVKGGAMALNSAITSALNTIAYDTATWIGSGGKGQKPMWETEGWGTYLANIGDNAAGTFIEDLGKNGTVKFNLCNPDLNVRLRIGLGLKEQVRPTPPSCSFSQLKAKWETEVSKPDFLTRFQVMFDPAQNDMGVALSLQTGILETIAKDTREGELKRQTAGNWIDQASTKIKESYGMPDQQKDRLAMVKALQTGSLLKYTGSALTDAANVFVNQLAITAFNTWLASLGGKGSDPFDWSRLTNPSAGPDATIGGGIAATKESLNSVIQPRFNVRGDYDIMTELSSCPNPAKAGPTNCVIDENFKKAVMEKETVANAIKKGYLKRTGAFGFISPDLEPNYLEGYPYRSIIILRKFRIVPVGWEIAAQYIKTHPDVQENTLDSLYQCFNQNKWCKNLVDPNWVLKAPLNYCRKEGPGPENLSSDPNTIARNENYCADEQSCIKENDDGSCKLYGYCTEERRQWKFDSEKCEPIYNTCQTFKQADGKSVSYLKNTLNYSGCTTENVGCQAYCTNFDYASGKYTCTNSTSGDKIYLDRDAESCDSESEGCRSLVRTKEGMGANLIVDSSFENDTNAIYWNSPTAWSDWGATTTEAYNGALGLSLKTGALNKEITVSPSLEHSIKGEAFSLSFYAKNCTGSSTYMMEDQAGPNDLTTSSDWQYFQTSHIFETDNNKIKLIFNIANAGCVIDAIKLERAQAPTAYSDYLESGQVYEKLMPSYLESLCIGASTDPAECKDFARKCQESEVGCEMYTSDTTGEKVPAKIKTEDLCVKECVGFDTYLQSDSNYESLSPQYFIPSSAKACNAQEAGCDQFTNLDKLGNGAESIEYYSYLRQCVKPADPSSNCSEFYTWEGSNEAGFQLKVVSLKASGSEPAYLDSQAEENAKCNETIYKLSPLDPAYNPDCREFYNKDGSKSYHLYSQTISCTDDCHPFRRTDLNIVKDLNGNDISDLNVCKLQVKYQNNQGSIEIVNNQCVFCKNGGTLSDDKKSCIYNAVTDQSRTCSAASSGCREYTGNAGQNLKVVLNNDFETGDSQGWAGIGGTTVDPKSTESINAGGHSLQVNNNALPEGVSINVGQLVQQNKSYVLSFIAKANAGLSLSAKISDASNSSAFGSVSIGTEWQKYQLNLSSLDHTVAADEVLAIEANSPIRFYIDNIKLTEISDRYYLIQDSWQTPDSCNQDLYGNPRALYMLGCDKYTDRENQEHYLKSFSSLCGENSIGCELMIDTQNSNSPASQNFNAGNPSGDEVTTPKDSFIYAVYDQQKECKQEQAGCQRLGKPYAYEGTNVYQDTYLINAPDKYSKSLCTADAIDCNEYSSDKGPVDFKDPGDKICEWRQAYQATSTNAWNWYQKRVKRCGGNTGAVCLSDKDCNAGVTCQAETNDILCDTDLTTVPKTFGEGNIRVSQPRNNWVGYCPIEASGCSELIDPLSGFSSDMLFNSDFMLDVAPPLGVADGWTAVGPVANNVREQRVKLEPFTTYRLAGYNKVNSNTTSLSLVNCNSQVFKLDPTSNSLLASNVTFNLSDSVKSVTVYSGEATACTVHVDQQIPQSTKIEFKKLAVSYQLAGNLDSNSCNGTVNNDEGCVLFNQRDQNGSSLSALTYDADLKSDTPATAASSDLADSNKLIKVTPNRVCDKWLTCVSKVPYKDQDGQQNYYCSDIGLCNNADDKGNCTNVLYGSSVEQTVDLAGGLPADKSNVDGYSKVSYSGVTEDDMKGAYPLNAMKQRGDYVEIPNGNFEVYQNSLEPSSWKLEGGGAWSANQFKIINSQVAAQDEGIRYPVENKALLKVGASFKVDSEPITIMTGGQQYVFSVRLNTLNLSQGNAIVDIKDQFKNTISSVSLAARSDWTLKVISFTSNVSPIYFSLRTDTTVGNFYVDDLKLTPALESRNNWLTTQSCRLYPKSDSLACDYTDDDGIKFKGWKGYCLEHDRKPGNPEACLLWWPGDRVKSDDIIENGAGYQGQTPLYYCLESEALIPVKKMKKALTGGYVDMPCGADCLTGTDDGASQAIKPLQWSGCPHGYSTKLDSINHNIIGGGCGGTSGWVNFNWNGVDAYNLSMNIDDSRDRCNYACNANGTLIVEDKDLSNTGKDPAYAWYEYDGVINTSSPIHTLAATALAGGSVVPAYFNLDTNISSEPNEEFKFYDPVSNAVYDDKIAYCKTIAQTVTDSGQNKYWSGRVFEGSNYAVPTLKYDYETYHRSYGSALQPASFNPEDWDGLDGNPTRDPLYVSHFGDSSSYNSAVHGGRPYTINSNTVYPHAVSPYIGSCSKSGEPCVMINSGVLPDTTFKCDVSETCNPFPVKNNAPQTAVSLLSNLFAQSFGTWTWDNTPNVKHYVRSALNWSAPSNLCPSGTPDDDTRNSCAFTPTVTNVKVNQNNTSDVIINNNSFVNFTFNSNVNSQQMPLVMYEVLWGGSSVTTVSGVQIADQPDPNNPHSLFHLYSYWDLANRKASGDTSVISCDENYCYVKPKVKIQDNWGWCNGDDPTAGRPKGTCSVYVSFPFNIAVRNN